MEFSNKLKILRLQANFTQNELADKLFISRQAVSNYEQGRGYPSIDILVEMSKLFNTDLDELLSTGMRNRHFKNFMILISLMFLGSIVNMISLYYVRGDADSLLLNMVFLISISVMPFMCTFIYLLFQYKPPKRINNIYGYRTSASMRNQLMWDYSQAYFSLLFAKAAIVLMCLGIVFGIFTIFLNSTAIIITACILSGIQVLIILVPIFFVEQRLRRLFNKKT